MQANLLLRSLDILNHIPGLGSAHDFHVVFTKEGYVVAQSGIITAKLDVSLGINRSIAVSWNRFSSFLKTLGSKNVEFYIEDDKLHWKCQGSGYSNKGKFTFIDPVTLMFPMDISIPPDAKSIPTTPNMRKSFYFFMRSVDFDKYERLRGVSLSYDLSKPYIIIGASDEKTLGLSELSDFEEPVSSFMTEDMSILIPHTIVSIVSDSEAHLSSRIFYSKNQEGVVNTCGYLFEGGFVISGVERFQPLDFEKNKNRFVPKNDIPYIPFSCGFSETIDRMSVMEDGLDLALTHFIQKDGKLILMSESVYGGVSDSFDIPFQEEAELKCVTKLLKKASSSLDGMFPIHATGNTSVFTNEHRSIYFIVSPYRGR